MSFCPSPPPRLTSAASTVNPSFLQHSRGEQRLAKTAIRHHNVFQDRTRGVAPFGRREGWYISSHPQGGSHGSRREVHDAQWPQPGVLQEGSLWPWNCRAGATHANPTLAHDRHRWLYWRRLLCRLWWRSEQRCRSSTSRLNEPLAHPFPASWYGSALLLLMSRLVYRALVACLLIFSSLVS